MSSARPRARRERLLIRELADEVLVYDLERYKAVCLNRAAAAVWERCDGATEVEGIARAVAQELGEPFTVDAVWCALDGLEKGRLIESLRGAGQPTRTRREWLRELARAGVVLMPAVLSVVAPSAVEAASFISSAACKNIVDPTMCGGTRCSDTAGNCLKVPQGKGFTCKCQ